MFNEIKFRNTFILTVFTVLIPLGLWLIALGLYKNSGEFLVFNILISVVAFFISLVNFIKFIKHRKTWQPLIFKVIGLTIASLGVLGGLYFVFLICLAIIHPSYFVGM